MELREKDVHNTEEYSPNVEKWSFCSIGGFERIKKHVVQSTLFVIIRL